ncbi:hypothetical protein INT47_007202 [Mucor saturninus]|uniref:Uncharacterized protein n=1 Tax=Mucor saturninus TaxID=64648 RepID=A0A8H7V4Q3_9FUNG|nr:hypothetical protein INT47_007202 [Mucor saturninus]
MMCDYEEGFIIDQYYNINSNDYLNESQVNVESSSERYWTDKILRTLDDLDDNDEFQPYDITSAPCVAFYLQVNNLPLEKCIKKENTMVLALMEGSHEPNTCQTQRLLFIATNQLHSLYFGVQKSIFNSGKHDQDYSATVRACCIKSCAIYPYNEN